MSQAAIRRITRLYYEATRRTIERDLREAIELLKALPGEPSRAKVAVYMDGLSQMRSEWRIESQHKRAKTTTDGARTAAAKTRSRRRTTD